MSRPSILIGTVVFAIPLIAGLLVYYNGRPIADSQETATSSALGKQLVQATSTLADRLLIPRLHIDAHVQAVGLTAKGDMATPGGIDKYRDVAWYRFGAVPGEAGNAVIAGHLDNGFGLPAVFKNLYQLQRGDEILVVDNVGESHRFRVATTTSYAATSATSRQEVFRTSGPPRLVIVTCEGTWVPEKKMYTGRYVVYADMVQ